MTITPICGSLDASVRVPGSKSLTNRALVLAALAEGQTTLVNASRGDDSRDLAGALRALGIGVVVDDAGTITVQGGGGRMPHTGVEVHAGLGGTTARFLIALACTGHGEYLIDAAPRMRQRPVGDLIQALGQLGAQIESTDGHLPVRVRARGLSGGRAVVSGEVSSQFLSALLLVAPTARAPVELIVTGHLGSRPYVDMTLATLAAFGIEVERDAYTRFVVTPSSYRTPGTFVVEGDASAASYFFAAPAIAGGRVRVEGIGRASRQGDIGFVDVLARMGCTIDEDDRGIGVACDGAPLGIDVDLSDMPDTAQTLAVMAPFASGPTTVRGIASARLKECDRVQAVCEELRKLGADVVERPDGLIVTPGNQLRGGLVKTYDDHRMAMAFALIGLRVPGVVIENPACVTKSFPGYFEQLERLCRD
jgi:3-phosphoshikimate 1-carboxyvinyltransferase